MESCESGELLDLPVGTIDNTEISSPTPRLVDAEIPLVDAKVFDGAAVVQMLSQKTSKTFGEFTDNVFLCRIYNASCKQLNTFMLFASKQQQANSGDPMKGGR